MIDDEGRALFARHHEVLKWGTHAPLLAAAVASSPGSAVLELGAGRFSTPMLVAMCALGRRRLVSADNSAEWLAVCAPEGLELSCDHEKIRVEDWNAAIERFAAQRWGVIFVDHWPQDRRGCDVERLANSAEWIVMHDTQDPACGYDFGPGWAFGAHDDRFFPRSTVVSKTRRP